MGMNFKAIHKVIKEVAPYVGIGGVSYAVIKDQAGKSKLKATGDKNTLHIPLSDAEADHIANGGEIVITYGCGTKHSVK